MSITLVPLLKGVIPFHYPILYDLINLDLSNISLNPSLFVKHALIYAKGILNE